MNARPIRLILLLGGLGLLSLIGCANTQVVLGTGADAGGDKGIGVSEYSSLSISPQDPKIDLTCGGVGTSVRFTVRATRPDGRVVDVTSSAKFSLENSFLGSIDGGLFKSSRCVGGATIVTATLDSLAASTTLTAKLKLSVLSGVDAAAAKLFADAASVAGAQPTWLYPNDGVLLPQNLGALTFMWEDTANDLWEVSLSNGKTDIRLYSKTRQVAITQADWTALAETNREDRVDVVVRGLSQADPSTVGVSATRRVSFSREAIHGGIYYFMVGDTTSAIMRHDFDKPDEAPEAYIKPSDTQDPKTGGKNCVGCHAVSQDGKTMALMNHGAHLETKGWLLDVATKTVTCRDCFTNIFGAAFTADGKALVAPGDKQLAVFDPHDPTRANPQDPLKPVATRSFPESDTPSYVDISPDPESGSEFKERQVVFVTYPAGWGQWPWEFKSGKIYIAPLPGTTPALSIGEPKVLVSDPALSSIYPSFSPDGNWVLFAQTTGLSVAVRDPNAPFTLSVIHAGGKRSKVLLTRANGGAKDQNSWPKWAPFSQTYQGGKLFWMSWVSNRNYGNLGTSRTPQLWMAAFDPKLAEQGKDPSYPAFWLPFQDSKTNNHSAQWTRKIVPRPD